MRYILILTILLISGCASTASMQKDEEWLFLRRMDYKELPSPNQFHICYGSGCQQKADITLTKKQWTTIRALFKNNKTAADERRSLTKAIGQFETFAGEQSPIRFDRAENVFETQYGGQLDCVDESINSTFYLLLLRDQNLLQYHQVMFPTSRGHFIGGWPHNTAVIQDISTNRPYVVDSWFLDNGSDAQVVPLDLWQSGWSPKKENQRDQHQINDKGQWTPLPQWLKS